MRHCLYVLICLTALTAQARLGETLPQLEARFGKGSATKYYYTPAKAYLLRYTFSTKSVRVNLEILDGVCSQISYTFIPNSDRIRFVKADVDKILELNKAGGYWVPMDPPVYHYPESTYKPKKTYRRSDGKAYAYITSSDNVTFVTKAHLAMLEKLIADSKVNVDPLDGL